MGGANMRKPSVLLPKPTAQSQLISFRVLFILIVFAAVLKLGPWDVVAAIPVAIIEGLRNAREMSCADKSLLCALVIMAFAVCLMALFQQSTP